MPHYYSRLRGVIEQSPRWMIGVAVVTPTVALIQGIALLQNYRKHHQHIPYPHSPSQGLVVSIDERSHRSTHYTIPEFLKLQKSSPPLRLLVIGDSLAAGVGVIHRATPVLPESIARTLSQKLGGRPVYWTCIGKPGAAMPEIIRDIETHDQMLLVRHNTVGPKPLWQEAVDKQADSFRERRDRIVEWWQQFDKRRKSTPAEESENKESDQKDRTSQSPVNPNPIAQWWNNIREDVRTFGEAWRGAKQAEGEGEGLHDTDRDDADDDRALAISDPLKLWKQWKMRLQRRESLRGDPAIVGQYDIAVVLTGGNDIKHAWLPFMMTDHPDADGKSVQERLQLLVKTLQLRMNLALERQKEGKNTANSDKDEGIDSSQEVGESQLARLPRDDDDDASTRRHPLVVFPAIPITLVPQLHKFPMRYFVYYIFQRLEKHKKILAKKFPGEVMFVEPPPLELFEELDEGKGQIYEDLQAESVVLKLTNVTQRVQDHVEEKFNEYKERWAQMMTRDREENEEHSSRNDYDHPDDSFSEYGHKSNGSDDTTSEILSYDQLHPNDRGYDIWGRFIASEILKQWNAGD